MYAARYFPGLSLSVADVDQMTPEQTAALRKAGGKILRAEAEERLIHTKAIARAAAGARGR